MQYKVKAVLNEEKIEGEYEIKQLLEKIEEVIECQQKRREE